MDWSWRPGIDLCWDVTRKLPLPDKSIKGIYTEHMIEHLSFDRIGPLFNEFKRILKKDGTLRIVVPDAELYLDLYQSKKCGENVRFPYEDEYLTDTPMMHVNRIFRGYEHQYAYDFQTLAILLDKCGYSHIIRQSFNNGRDSNLLIDSTSRQVESLYLEAVV